MNKLENIQEEVKNFYIRYDWSEENNGDCYKTQYLVAKNIDEIWTIIFEEEYEQGLREQGEFLDKDMFSWTEYYSKSNDKMVFYSELSESDKTKNEYDELDIYYKTWTITVTEEEG